MKIQWTTIRSQKKNCHQYHLNHQDQFNQRNQQLQQDWHHFLNSDRHSLNKLSWRIKIKTFKSCFSYAIQGERNSQLVEAFPENQEQIQPVLQDRHLEPVQEQVLQPEIQIPQIPAVENNDRPYVCPICSLSPDPVSFSQASTLQNHMNRCHSDTKEKPTVIFIVTASLLSTT